MNPKAIMQLGLLVLSASAVVQNSLATDAGKATVSGSTRQAVATFEQLDALRSQNALLAEAVKNADLKSKLNSGGSGIGSSSPILGQSVTRGSVTVLQVSSHTNQLVALIATRSGDQVRAKVGNKIAGVGTVKSITANEVVVVDGNELISLPFAGEGRSLMGGGR